MSLFYNLKIAVKLLIGFILVALVAAIIGIMGYTGMNSMSKVGNEITNNMFPSVESLMIMSEAQTAVDSAENALLTRELIGKERQAQYDRIVAAFKRAEDARKIYETLSQTPEEKVVWDKLVPAWDKWESDDAAYISLVKDFDKSQSNDAYLKMVQQSLVTNGVSFSAAEGLLGQLIDINKKAAKDAFTNFDNVHTSSVNIMIISIVIGFLVAIALGIFISRIISNPITRLVEAADKLSIGDINVKVESKTKDEIGNLMESFGRMITNVREQALAVEKIAAGDMSIDVRAKSDNDLLNKKLAEMIQTIKALITEIGNLSDSAVEGRLSVRGDERKFSGEYSTIVKGINKTLDAVVQPINEALTVLEEMSKANLQVAVEGNYKGDHAVIKDAINNTIKAFNEVLGNISSASEQVASGSKQVSTSSQALSQGSTEQASAIEEITASIEEVASQTRQNAANANQANELASAAKEKAVQGNMQMAEMLKAMAEINDSSNNISKIIKVIDEIAFQTNILALNAAVEAARAGQHGKGFAVVAEEVRNLAARSANAAKETTAMIEGSIKKVDIGTKIANDTAGALNQIVDGVAKAADLVGDIAVASNDQASGIAQVNQAITQVAQVVQSNSATSEESAAASEELSSQAELLKELVSKYKLKKNTLYKGNSNNLSPDVLKMLEDMASQKHSSKQNEAHSEAAAAKLKIALDDMEFGKY